MPGPLPKPAAKRRRRNAETFDVVQLPASGRKGRSPRLPLADAPKDVRAWWRQMWRSPMATQWHTVADVDALARLAVLIHLERTDVIDPKLMAEARQLEDRFGLTPKARRQLRWVVVDDTEDDAPVASIEDRRRGRLKAVDPDAVAGA